MFVEASLFFSFDDSNGREDTMAPSLADRLLQLLSFGQVRGRWVRERIDPADLFEQLAGALSSAGLTDLVSATVDGETVYRDQSNRDLDLAPTLAALHEAAATAGDEHGAQLELVARTQDDVGTYVVQLLARRVHTVDTPPIQLRIYGLLREFDVRGATGGYRDGGGSIRTRLYDRIMRRLVSARSHDVVMGPLGEHLLALARRIEEKVRLHLRTDQTDAVLLPCIVRPQAQVEYEQHQRRDDLADAALFRGAFADATYYLTLWSSALTELRATVERTLIVDDSGRPIVHIAREPVDLAHVKALVPDGDITTLGATLDIAYFGGNTFHDELVAASCIAPSEEEDCSHAHWQTIRHRELDVRPIKDPWWKGRFLTGGVSFGSRLYSD